MTRFRVTTFRSVADSGWVDVDDVTALVGVNESGKTNLLLPLWKLNPAQEGELYPNADYPKAMFQEVRAAPSAYRFVEAEFELSDREAVTLPSPHQLAPGRGPRRPGLAILRRDTPCRVPPPPDRAGGAGGRDHAAVRGHTGRRP